MKKIIVFLITCFFISINGISQDIIYKNDNTKVEGKVLKVTDTEIEYRKKGQPDGPIRVTSIENVHQIVYEGGYFEIFKLATPKENKVAVIEVAVSEEVSVDKQERETIIARETYSLSAHPGSSSVASSLIAKSKVRLQFVDNRVNPNNFGKMANGVTWIPIKYNRKDKKNIVMPMFTRMITSELNRDGFLNPGSFPDYTLKIVLKDIYYETTDKFTKMMYYQRCKIEYILEKNSTQAVLFSEEVFADHNGQANENRKMKFKGIDFFYFSLSKNANKLFNETNFESFFE